MNQEGQHYASVMKSPIGQTNITRQIPTAQVLGAQLAYDVPVYKCLYACRHIVLLQASTLVCSLVFLYMIWWSIAFGLLVTLIGFEATRLPADRMRRKWIVGYYYGNLGMLPCSIISIILWITWMLRLHPTIWIYVAFLVGGAFNITIGVIYYLAGRKAKSFLTEFDRQQPVYVATTFVRV